VEEPGVPGTAKRSAAEAHRSSFIRSQAAILNVTAGDRLIGEHAVRTWVGVRKLVAARELPDWAAAKRENGIVRRLSKIWMALVLPVHMQRL
jgi:hypothetical protein